MDYTAMQRKDLLPLCVQRGLPTWGSQALVAARLAKHDADTSVPQPRQETPMAQITAGPDNAKDEDLLAQANAATAPLSASAPPTVDPVVQQLIEAQARILQLQAALAAKPGAAPTAGDVATPTAIAAAARGENVFRFEFPMYPGMELGDGLHQQFCAQTVAEAAKAGYTTRGGARRATWGIDKATGHRTAVYEIYARKQ